MVESASNGRISKPRSWNLIGHLNVQIIVNGESRSVATGLTAAQLIDLLELGGRRLAVEINREILPRSRFAEHALRDGDRIEIVQAIGGG